MEAGPAATQKMISLWEFASAEMGSLVGQISNVTRIDNDSTTAVGEKMLKNN